MVLPFVFLSLVLKIGEGTTFQRGGLSRSSSTTPCGMVDIGCGNPPISISIQSLFSVTPPCASILPH